jgi:hypothetical protein
MSFLYITEYQGQPKDFSGNVIPAGLEPALATQRLTFTATANVLSAAFNVKTTFIRVHVDAAAFIRIATTPTVTATNGSKMAANTTEFFGLDKPSMKLAVNG